MSTQVLELKRGDTAPQFRAQLLDDTTPVNLTTATAVRLRMRNHTGDQTVSASMTVEAGTTGWVHRAWADYELAVEGTYKAEVEVTWADGTIQTFPRNSYVRVIVNADLG